MVPPQHTRCGVQELLDLDRLEHHADVVEGGFIRRLLVGVACDQGRWQGGIALPRRVDDLASSVPLFQGVVA
jgi:hypothetical protein